MGVADAELPDAWPGELRGFVRGAFGSTGAIEPLGGMSGGSVARWRGADASVIVKRSRSPVETHVYTGLSGVFARQGVSIPRLHWAGQDGDDYWIAIEDIPRALPRERWEADAEAIAMLRRLHDLPLNQVPLPPDAYTPAWPAELTAGALSLFPEQDARALAPLLEQVRDDALALFDPHSPISGDPNPLNWGLRDDGGLVLFDWERFTLGTPAIDMAIAVPGLGEARAYQRVAQRYLSLPASDERVAALATRIHIAKIWVVIEFLSGVASRAVQPPFSVGDLVPRVHGWLRGNPL